MKTKFAIYSVLLAGLLLTIMLNCKKEAMKVAPTVTITEATNVTANSATVSSTITADGGSEVLSRGVCWNITGNPTTSDTKTTDGKGLGSFTSSLTSLSPGTTYNLKSYATNAIGTAYSSQTTFKTLALLATLTTTEASTIASTSFNSGGNVTNDGGAEVTARGVCWSTNQNPSIADSKTTDGTSSGIYTSSVTSLTPGTTYYIRSYSTNSIGTAYGNQITAITLAILPTVTTTDLSSITSNSATSGGNITNDGGAAITARGVCWSTNQNPTIADTKTSDATGKGVFTSNITGLTPGSTYYIRAYATNSVGTSYGNQVTSSTTAILPAVSTAPLTQVAATTVMSAGTVTNNGGAVITASGVCWSTGSSPTIFDNKIVNTSNSNAFQCLISGLTPGTKYYVRAFATNSIGTGYGDIVTLTSLSEETLRDALQAFPGIKGEIVTTNLNGTTVTCKKVNGLLFMQGDILVSQNKGAAIDQQDQKWPENIVYYSINDNFPNNSRVTDGFKEFENKTNITFQKRTNESNYIEFNYIKDAGCYSYIGMLGGKQEIVIDNWGEPADIAHEIGHAIGLLHEQSKSTRDQYVTINFENIEDGYSHNFNLYPNSLNTPDFDFNSLMLYSSYAFSIEYGKKPTITKKDGSAFLPQRAHFTESDFSIINQLYPFYPDVTSLTASSITTTSAICGGNVISDRGSPVTQRGIYWGTSKTSPSNTKTFEGTGTGSFTSSLTGLSPNTTYYYEAYAKNSVGTSYGAWISFTTSPQIGYPTVTTVAASSITTNSATSGGNVTADGNASVTAKGVCWSTSQNPTTANSKTNNGTGTGNFSSSITSLTPGTTYYVRSYAINSVGTSYGSQLSFTTSVQLQSPTLTTTAATSITTATATSGGNITSDGGASVTARGVCWSTSSTPTTSNTKTTNGTGTGSYTSSITGLNSNTTYYVRAYAINSIGTAYGTQVSFTTNQIIDIPTVTTNQISSITQTTATSGGNVTSDGNSVVSARGVCWGTSSSPTTGNNKTSNGTGTGSFTSSITGLSANTTYYVRAYATNSEGTAYGSNLSFTTNTVQAQIPTIITTAASSVSTTSATSGGSISSDGGAAITIKGICWGTSSNPTTANFFLTNGLGNGAYTDLLTGLSPNTTYFMRAFATNSAGTGYGNQIIFTTTSSGSVPTLTTTAASAIATTSATSGGNISSDGGVSVTARGVCWSTSQNPITSNSKTTDGTGTGSFTSSITGLTAGTTYYLRAYATNSAGTAYGSQVSFATTNSIVYGSVSDVDGNSYSTVTIGTQVWMAENLKTTKYKDNSAIPLVTDQTAWSNLTTSGYCYYDNNTTTYGALYNWYTVNTGKLCPTGWHVPSDTEWYTLVNYLGGYLVAGGKLKETGTSHWLNPNTGATNITGFAAVPGGIRFIDGVFSAIGDRGYWWCSTERQATTAWSGNMGYNHSNVLILDYNKPNGFSVRCIKD